MSSAVGKARHGFVWVTAAFFLLTVAGHWGFAWIAYAQEQSEHGQPVDGADYFAETMRDTLENWQSEFLQLIWQVAGLAFLLHIGSPQSKEGDDRKEEKLDALLEKAYGKQDAERIKAELAAKYPKE
jgi:hypothetical protein